jgi:hypothetical protein
MGKTEQAWVHTDFALSMFSRDAHTARLAYADFVSAHSNDNDLDVKGHPKKPRVFGDDRFLETLSL